ncbi:hypothetical protein B0H13DRAFT_1030108 [Mycena leptocephala]|nr:hypothetical protein B0H13DRAFT_1030108 [Mycena leptocephala]
MPTIDLRRRLVELDAQIVEQKQVLRDLQQNRAAVERELHASASFLVLTLPAEVTAEIFVHCLPSVDDIQYWLLGREVPISLAGVCRAWRDIAMATHTLWSTLFVRFDSIPTQIISKPGLVENKIDRRLARAGIHPLTLDFVVRKDEGAVESFPTSRLRDIIHRYSHRMQHLELSINHRDIRELGLDSAAFPRLQSARLHCQSNYDAHRLAHVFNNAPRFHDLQMYSGFIPSTLTFPWSQLTKYEGSIQDLDLFTLAQNLTEVKCQLVQDEGNFSVVAHSRLTSLTVVQGSLDILKYLTLPSLKHLYVCEIDSFDYYWLEPFLIRSSPPLVSLSVHGDDDCFEHWHRCLPRVVSTLENLEVSQASTKVLSVLFHRSNLGNLRTLSLPDVEGGVDLYWVTQYLYSRSDALRSFRLVWTFPPFLDGEYYLGPEASKTTDTISGHLSRIARTGMDIYLGTENKNYAAINE